jgi:tRNA pseudouridine38-40 synthase
LNDRNIKLIIEYDGTNYKGWQTQKPGNAKKRKSESPGIQNNIVTIQEIVQEAICKITNEDIKLTGAGRTDSGVHAQGQVANFHTSSDIAVQRFPFAINAYLPPDIAVKFAEEAPLSFNARRDAKAREYMYVINNSKFRSALERLYSYHVPLELDIQAMKQSADYFKGEHDFTGFTCGNSGDRKTDSDEADAVIARKSDVEDMTKQSQSIEIASPFARNDPKDRGNPLNPPYQGEDSRLLSPFTKGERRRIRNIMKLDIEKKSDFIYITVKANSFLMHMVRYMVAALLETGRGKMKPEDIKLYLEPSLKKWTHSRVPARGLFLMKVEY